MLHSNKVFSRKLTIKHFDYIQFSESIISIEEYTTIVSTDKLQNF